MCAPKSGGGVRRVGGVGRELERIAERAPALAASIRELDDHLAMADLRVVEHLVDGRDRTEADVLVGELRHPLAPCVFSLNVARTRRNISSRAAPLGELLRDAAPRIPSSWHRFRQKCGSSAPTVTQRPSFVS